MYQIIVPKIVLKELENIDQINRLHIYEKIKELESGNFLTDKALKGKYKGKFRKRAGNYRIIYFKENNLVLITLVRIAHRREVYWL